MNTLIQWVSIAVTAYPKEDLEILDKSSTGGAKIKWNIDWVSLTFLLQLNVSSLIAIELTLSIWVLFLYRNGLRKSYRVRYISLNPNFQGFKQYQWLPPRQKSKDRQRRTIGFFCLFFLFNVVAIFIEQFRNADDSKFKWALSRSSCKPKIRTVPIKWLSLTNWIRSDNRILKKKN